MGLGRRQQVCWAAAAAAWRRQGRVPLTLGCLPVGCGRRCRHARGQHHGHVFVHPLAFVVVVALHLCRQPPTPGGHVGWRGLSPCKHAPCPPPPPGPPAQLWLQQTEGGVPFNMLSCRAPAASPAWRRAAGVLGAAHHTQSADLGAPLACGALASAASLVWRRRPPGAPADGHLRVNAFPGGHAQRRVPRLTCAPAGAAAGEGRARNPMIMVACILQPACGVAVGLAAGGDLLGTCQTVCSKHRGLAGMGVETSPDSHHGSAASIPRPRAG